MHQTTLFLQHNQAGTAYSINGSISSTFEVTTHTAWRDSGSTITYPASRIVAVASRFFSPLSVQVKGRSIGSKSTRKRWAGWFCDDCSTAESSLSVGIIRRQLSREVGNREWRVGRGFAEYTATCLHIKCKQAMPYCKAWLGQFFRDATIAYLLLSTGVLAPVRQLSGMTRR